MSARVNMDPHAEPNFVTTLTERYMLMLQVQHVLLFNAFQASLWNALGLVAKKSL